jgi:hypothetical protein
MAAQSTLPEQRGQEYFEQPPAHERLVLLPPAVCRFEALRQFNAARERLDLLETPQVATVAVTSEPGTANQPSGSGAEPSGDELWVAKYSNKATQTKQAAQVISDALRDAPDAPIQRYLLQEPRKPQIVPEKPPEQSREYGDYIAARIARSIYKLSVVPVLRPALPALSNGAFGFPCSYFCSQVNSAIMDAVKFNYDTLAQRLRELAFLNKGLRITLTDERARRTAPTDTQAAPATEAKAPMEDTCSTRQSADDPQLQLNWEDVALCFIGDHQVIIRAGDRTQTRHYKQIKGCENKHSGLPTEQWNLLRTLVKSNGLIPDQARHGAEWEIIQKRIERTRKVCVTTSV